MTKALLLALAVAASPAAAQMILPTTTDDLTFAVQVRKPFLADDDFTPYSSVLDLDMIIRWGPTVFFQAGVPIAVGQADFVDGTSVFLGNVRGNFLFGEPGSLRSYLGATLPTASNLGGPQLAVLLLARPSLDEEEAWGDDLLSVRGGVIPSWQVSEGAQVGFRVGGAVALPTDFDNVALYARPAAWGRVVAGSAELRGELATSYLINSDEGFEEQFHAYLDLGAGLPEVRAQPGVFFRLPLDNGAREALDFSVGVSAQF